MKLSTFIKRRGYGAIAEIAKRGDVSRSSVERAAAGAAVTAKTARGIEKGTGGKVKARALVGL